MAESIKKLRAFTMTYLFLFSLTFLATFPRKFNFLLGIRTVHFVGRTLRFERLHGFFGGFASDRAIFIVVVVIFG